MHSKSAVTRWACIALVPILFALVSVTLGRDANWDFLNYRRYIPYAFLHHRLTLDVLVAGHATFYNPLLELPFYLIASHLPGIIAGFLLALAASIAFVPLFLLAREAIPGNNFWGAFLLALAGLCGGGVLGQIGIVSWDVPLGCITFFALYLLGKDDAAALNQPISVYKYRLLFAGVLAGSAAGFKLTAAIYPVGLVAGIFFASVPGIRDRFARVVVFSLGTVGGIILFGGYWMIILYHAFGNPAFPYFNGLFHSDFAAPGSNRDATFLPQDWKTALAFPFLFSANSRHVAEYDFRDIHIAVTYALLPLAVLGMIFTRTAPSRFARLLMIFFIVSYAVWEELFSIYRYILPLEMLAPVIIFLCVTSLPLSPRAKAGATASLLLIAQLAIHVDFTRLPWDKSYIAVTMPPVPKDAMVLMVGPGPLGYIVPSLPQSVPAIRADSGLATSDRFADIIRDKIEHHVGPYLVVFTPGNDSAVDKTLATYGLHLLVDHCLPITSNVANPALLCPVN